MIFSLTVEARQYIQCSNPNTWERFVINLDGDESTFFATNGVHLPDEQRILKDLFFERSDNDFTYFVTSSSATKETIIISNDYLNRALSYFVLDLVIRFNTSHEEKIFTLNCFSSIYP